MTIASSKNLTFVGIGTICVALGTFALSMFDGDPATVPNIGAAISGVIAGVGLIMAKGSSSTGGTVNNAGVPILDPSPPVTVPTASIPAVAVSPKGFARLGLLLAFALAGCATVSALNGSTGPIPVTVAKDAAGKSVVTSTVTVSTTPAVLFNGSCLKPLAIIFDSVAGHHDACNLSIPLAPVGGVCP